MADYVARIKTSARRSFVVAHLAGEEVLILPETREWIPEIMDYRFKVIPANAKGSSLDEEITICGNFLTPLNNNARSILKNRL